MRSSALALAALAALAVACGGARGEDPVSEDTSEVQGGRTDTSTAHNFAVGIAIRETVVCSGTLIAPNLILTARHCVTEPSGGDAVSCERRFGAKLPLSALAVTTSPDLVRALDEGVYSVADIVVPDNDGYCGNDIALVVLKETIPPAEAKPATPVVRFAMTDTSRIGGRITAFGYGLSSPGAKDSGQRRIREDIDILCVPGSEKRACTGDLAELAPSDAEFVTAGHVCSGDSGGGAFDQDSFRAGAPYVLGALSRGPQSKDTCLAAVYSRTDKHAAMIVTTALRAASVGGYPVPEWAEGGASSLPAIGETRCEGSICTSVDATEPAPEASEPAASGCSVGPRGVGPTLAPLLGLALVACVTARRRARSAGARARS